MYLISDHSGPGIVSKHQNIKPVWDAQLPHTQISPWHPHLQVPHHVTQGGPHQGSQGCSGGGGC